MIKQAYTEVILGVLLVLLQNIDSFTVSNKEVEKIVADVMAKYLFTAPSKTEYLVARHTILCHKIEYFQ